MANDFRLHKVTDSHLVDLAPHMRKADIDEVFAAGGYSPLEALRASEACTPRCVALVDRNGVVAIWGAGEKTRSLVGCPWMLASDRAELKYRRELLVLGKSEVAKMKARYDALENWVDARHTASIRWLKWLGFRIHPSENYGFLNLPFHRFEMAGDRFI